MPLFPASPEEKSNPCSLCPPMLCCSAALAKMGGKDHVLCLAAAMLCYRSIGQDGEKNFSCSSNAPLLASANWSKKSNSGAGLGGGSRYQAWAVPSNWCACFPLLFPGHAFYKWLKGNPLSKLGCCSWDEHKVVRAWVGVTGHTQVGLDFCLTAGRRKFNVSFQYLKLPIFFSGVCVEKRAFYRLISGLHASINIHLSARYLLQGKCYFLP